MSPRSPLRDARSPSGPRAASGLLLLLTLIPLSGCMFDPPGECSTATDCYEGARCDQGVCVMGCDQNAHCAGWEACNPTSHRCYPLPGRCSAEGHCQAWEDCVEGNVCQVTAGACNGPSDCEEWETCTSNACQLAAGRCDIAADCPGMWSACADHHCSSNPPGGNDIILWGSLYENGCAASYEALSPLTSPTNIQVGFRRCGPKVATVRPDGTMVYVAYGENLNDYDLRVFVRDSLEWATDTWSYPGQAIDNDPLIPTPPCDGIGGASRFVVNPSSGALLYACHNQSTYYDSAGAVVTEDLQLLAWNANGVLLATPYLSQDGLLLVHPDGTQVPVVGFPAQGSRRDIRPDGDGFRIALRMSAEPLSYQLWRVDAAGVMTLQAPYQDFAFPGERGSVMDSTGALYTLTWNPEDTTQSRVVRQSAEGATATIVYDEANAPEGSNNLQSATLRPYNLLINPRLVRGP